MTAAFSGQGKAVEHSVPMCAGCCKAAFFTPPADVARAISPTSFRKKILVSNAISLLQWNVTQFYARTDRALLRGNQARRSITPELHGQEKEPYIFVGLVCVRERYQGQGYMRKVMDIVFFRGQSSSCAGIFETDAKSKCDKYMHPVWSLLEYVILANLVSCMILSNTRKRKNRAVWEKRMRRNDERNLSFPELSGNCCATLAQEKALNTRL